MGKRENKAIYRIRYTFETGGQVWPHPVKYRIYDSNGKYTHLQVLSLLPGWGGPQAIFRPRQNKQARAGFLSSVRFVWGTGDMRRGERGDGEREWRRCERVTDEGGYCWEKGVDDGDESSPSMYDWLGTVRRGACAGASSQ